MQREPKQKYCRKRRTHLVPGNIDNSIDRKQERGDKRGETITLVGSYSQRENSTNKERYTNDREYHRWPTEFRQKQSQSLSGCEAGRSLREASRKIAKIDSKFPKPIPHQGELRMSRNVS